MHAVKTGELYVLIEISVQNFGAKYLSESVRAPTHFTGYICYAGTYNYAHLSGVDGFHVRL